MRAYSCIDSHGRWTEVPTQVQFSTSHDGHRSQPSPRTSNVGPSVRSNAASGLHFGILDVAPKNSNNASRSDATACAGSPRPSRGSSAQAFNVPDFDDDPEDDDDDRDEEPEHDAEEDAENELEERVTALDVLNVIRKYSNQAPRAMPPLAQNDPRKLPTSQKMNTPNPKTMTPTPTKSQKKKQKTHSKSA